VAIAFVDPVATFDVGLPFEGSEAGRDFLGATDEALAEAAVEEGRMLSGYDAKLDETRFGNDAERPPYKADQLEMS
jgi:hypothetical protein